MYKMKKSVVKYRKEEDEWTIKVDLPKEWANEMGIKPNAKDVMLSFDGEKIIIGKASKRRLGKWRKKI